MLEKIIEFEPAYDKRNTDPTKNYGIGALGLRFLLKGPEGVVQFVLYTNWLLPKNQREIENSFIKNPDVIGLQALFEPLPADLGYHSYKPHYEGQIKRESCIYLDEKPCYYDGSGLNAKPIYDTLLKEGSDGVWRELEEYYKRIFKGE